jgi:hypothetical protein
VVFAFKNTFLAVRLMGVKRRLFLKLRGVSFDYLQSFFIPLVFSLFFSQQLLAQTIMQDVLLGTTSLQSKSVSVFLSSHLLLTGT